jgi:adenosine deaminase
MNDAGPKEAHALQSQGCMVIDPSLPRIDLHRHLDGNVRLATILALAEEHGILLPASSVESLRAIIQPAGGLGDALAFFASAHWMTAVLADADACRRVARENVEDAHREGLDYVELRFSPAHMARAFGLPQQAVVDAVIAGVDEGRRATGMRVKLIGILSRTFGPEACFVELAALLARRNAIVALDLAGDEIHWPGELFAEHFRLGRDAGWAITVHAGEFGSADAVWTALRTLGAQRIGHGTRAIDDPALLEHLAAHRIGVEVQLTGNVQTSAVPSYAAHPLKAFLARGVVATINTDDPAHSGIDWAHECTVAATAAGLTPNDVRTAQRNALEVAFLSDAERAELLASVAAPAAAV